MKGAENIKIILSSTVNTGNISALIQLYCGFVWAPFPGINGSNECLNLIEKYIKEKYLQAPDTNPFKDIIRNNDSMNFICLPGNYFKHFLFFAELFLAFLVVENVGSIVLYFTKKKFLCYNTVIYTIAACVY